MKPVGSAVLTTFPSARLVTLTRAGSLNALTLPMWRDLKGYYLTSPPEDEKQHFYILRGEGNKSFCAGGDVLALNDPKLDKKYANEFYKTEYRVDYRIASMPMQQVALWRGYVLGSGVGVSLHSTYRVACAHTLFGMPETKIGTVPDVGSTFKLLRVKPQFVGAYMAITGSKVSGADLVYLGLATHYVSSHADMDKLEKDLTTLHQSSQLLDCLETHGTTSSLPPFSLAAMWPTLERAFTIKPDTTLEGIVHELKADGCPFARSLLQTMEQNSPLAMSVALENWKQQSAFKNILEGMELDYQLTHNKGPLEKEFAAGVDALLISKNNAPAWQYKTAADVPSDVVKGICCPVEKISFLKD